MALDVVVFNCISASDVQKELTNRIKQFAYIVGNLYINELKDNIIVVFMYDKSKSDTTETEIEF